ncbi:MAG TPA: hypothetical protein VKR52_18715 [Terracidiphilus sp.]|nr:hypothetical protein [Terracidiphilus sp.]
MLQSFLHDVFQLHYIHEVLHLLSGCAGSFIGTWAYLSRYEKRKGQFPR